MPKYNMKKLLQQQNRLCVYIILITLFIFVVFPIFSLFCLFNEKQAKNKILTQFNTHDYDIKINGHITPELWHGLSIKIHSILVTTKDNRELLHIGSMNCQFSWVNVIFGRYQLRRISINDVDLYEKNLLNYNLNNLFDAKQFKLALLDELNYLDINDIHSVGNNPPYPFDDGNLKIYFNSNTPEFKFGTNLTDKNIYLAITGTLDSFRQNLIKFNHFSTILYNENFNVHTTGTASYNLINSTLSLKIIDGNTEFMGYHGKINTGNLNISNSGLSLQNATLFLNISNEVLKQNLVLKIVDLTSNNYQSFSAKRASLEYKGSVAKNQFETLSIFNDIAIESNGSITSQSCTHNLAVKAPDAIKNSVKASLSGICDYFSNSKLFNFHLSGNLNESPLKLDLQILNYNKPRVVVAGYISNLNLSNVNQNKILPLYYDQNNLPFSWLSFIDMNANLNIKYLSLAPINLTNVKTDFNILNNKLNLNTLDASLYNGNLHAVGSIIKNNDHSYDIKTKQKFDNLDIKLMFKNIFDVTAISGKANILTDINVKNVSTFNDLHKNLKGRIKITATNGAFQGIDFNLFTSPKTLALTSIKTTPFNALTAKFNFINGISTNSTINFSSPDLITDGHGIINFRNSTLNYNLTIKSQLPQNKQKIKAVVIPVTVNGDLLNPKINIEKIYLSNKKSIAGKSNTSHHRKYHEI